MKFFIKIFILSFCLLLTLCSSSMAMGQFFLPRSTLVGEPAKDFELPSYKGEKISLSQARKEGHVILFFWATWCPHCRTALKEFQEMESAIKAKNVQMFVIDIGENAKTVGRYAERNNITMDILLDGDTAVASDYDVVGVPSYVFINQDGTIVDIRHDLPMDFEKLFIPRNE